MATLTLALGACLAGAVHGQSAPALPLDEAIAAALRDNAELRTARARAAAMRERPEAAAALPNPMLTYGAMDAVSGGKWPDTGEKRLMLEQELPGGGKRALRRGIAGREADTMQAEADAMAADLRMRVTETYHDLRATRRAVALAGDEQQLLRRLIAVAETRYATGERPQADVLKGQSELTLLKQRVVELETRGTTLQARLNVLLNRPAGASVGELTTPPPDTDPSVPTVTPITASRPELRAAAAQVERYRLEQALTAREGSPDYRLGVEYRALDDSADMAMLTFSVDLPVWRSRINANRREAALMRQYATDDQEAVLQRTALDAAETAARLAAARRTLALYTNELIPQAEARFTASEAAYRTGSVDFADLLESERFLLNARTLRVMAEGTIGMEAARLERALGITGGSHP